MIIKVTKKHIKKGVPGRIHSCPVALALMEQYPGGLKEVSVFPESIVLRERGAYISRTVYPSRSVSRFIDRFDEKKPVKPFNFKFSLASSKMGAGFKVY